MFQKLSGRLEQEYCLRDLPLTTDIFLEDAPCQEVLHWLAEHPDLPGVLVFADTRAIEAGRALAVLSPTFAREFGEYASEPLSAVLAAWNRDRPPLVVTGDATVSEAFALATCRPRIAITEPLVVRTAKGTGLLDLRDLLAACNHPAPPRPPAARQRLGNEPLRLGTGYRTRLSVDRLPARIGSPAFNHLLALAVEYSHEAFAITNASGSIEYVNPAFERLSGYHCAEVLGQMHSSLLVEDPETRQSIWLKLASGEAWLGTLSKQRKDGSAYELRTTILPVCASSGQLSHLLLLETELLDVPPPRLLVSAPAIEPDDASWFVSFCQNLRTPFTNIRLAATLLDDTASPDRRAYYLKVLESECQRGSRLVESLMELQALQREQPLATLDQIPLARWLPGLLTPFAYRARQRHQRFGCEYSPNLPAEIYTNRRYLERIIVELVDTACNHSPTGGSVAVRVKRSGGSGEQPGVALSVTSTGPAIPAQSLPYLFEQCYRLPGRSDPLQASNSGLGLVLAKRLADRLGARLAVESNDFATTFTLLLS